VFFLFMQNLKSEILCADKEKSQSLLSGSRLQLLGHSNSFDFNTIIRKSNHVVNKNSEGNKQKHSREETNLSDLRKKDTGFRAPGQGESPSEKRRPHKKEWSMADSHKDDKSRQSLATADSLLFVYIKHFK